MIHSQQLPLPSPPKPKPFPQPQLPKPFPFPHKESRMMIQRKSHPHPLLFLAAVLLQPQEEAVKSLIRVPPILFYALSYEDGGNVCRKILFLRAMRK